MCVASFFARVNERKLERELKKKRRERERKKGESLPIRKVWVEGGENLVRGVQARISVERREGRQARVAALPFCAFSHASGHFCVSGVSLGRLRKKERLLEVLIFSLLTNK